MIVTISWVNLKSREWCEHIYCDAKWYLARIRCFLLGTTQTGTLVMIRTLTEQLTELTKVNVDNVTVSVNHNIAIVSIFDLQQICDDGVGSHALDEVVTGLRDCLASGRPHKPITSWYCKEASSPYR